jgi:hypothetical protein
MQMQHKAAQKERHEREELRQVPCFFSLSLSSSSSSLPAHHHF